MTRKYIDSDGSAVSKNRGGAPRTRTYNAREDRDEFVRLELTEADKKVLSTYCTTLDELDAALEGLIDDGYKLSLKYDDYSKSVACFAFPPESSENAGYILTGRGRYPSRAIRQLVYKHHAMLEGDWAGAQRERQADDSADW